MYIKTLQDENIGPIENLKIDFSFNEEGKPKPIIFVGENGCGKSLLLSNIVDSFYCIAQKGFDNAMEKADTGGEEYYKNISPSQIKVGKEYLYSFISYKDFPVHYVFKAGKLSVEKFKELSNCATSVRYTWKENNSFKGTNATEEQSTKIFSENVVCYFGPDRYEKPNWLGNKYYSTLEKEHITLNTKISRYLSNPISVKGVTELNLKWLLDVIVDSRSDIEQRGENLNIAHINVKDLLLLGSARKNIETIMSKILGQDVYFNLKIRSTNANRFEIRTQKDNSLLVPSLDFLSTGQLALFNIFSTIIRYADKQDINKSIKLNDIQGIVVVDEIELHLHPSLQKDVLPELLHLFPKVQFIITTHSPLFLLGMEDTYGTENYEIYQLPLANKIDAEDFSEFQKAYTFLTNTERYKKEIREIINQYSDKKAL
ncbi:MAG: AAA family ATPase, partial [Pseudomonadota bacterium]|nr:AAA family ATPase [Pseudomonadota bacterium]